MSEKIPMLDLNRQYIAYKEELDQALLDTARSAHYILGPAVGLLEKAVADYLGVQNCIGVASGTDALVIALRALAIKTKGTEYFSPTDEIITTPFTFTATGGAILRAGATPVFVDIDPDSFNLDCQALARSVNANTVGIIPVHLYGQSCAMNEVLKLARQHNLFVVEDVAQAFGASYEQQKLGSLGDIAAFSFFPSKNLGAFGDGGLISTNDPTLAELSRMLGKHGGRDKYNVTYLGYNSRLDTLQAALLLVKLKYLDEMNERRRKLAAIYDRSFSGLSSLVTPPEIEKGHVYHQYTVRINEGRRDEVQKQLNQSNIATAVYYPLLLTEMDLYRNRAKVPFSLVQAEDACRQVLSLPIEPLFTDEQISAVTEAVKRVLA
jgi:dTDP-4-amino-4,6-dideoxygalactose transaminase